jgi:predicted RecB family nuclease
MLLSRETRKKLSALRRRLPSDSSTVAEPESRPPQEASPAPPPTVPGPDRASDRLPGAPIPVEVLLPGEVVENDHGTCYVMRPEIGGVQPLTDGPPAAFIDIETLGLASMPIFLVGVLCRVGAGAPTYELTQILARDFPEEAPLLAETRAALQGAEVLFTYNGATFDLPLLGERAIYHAVDWLVTAEHVDLLKPARRRFRGRFPDCKLQTLETMLCGRTREDDIPGAEIPRRYQEFVRSQDARLLEVVVRHNQLDLLTLAEIVPHCLE